MAMTSRTYRALGPHGFHRVHYTEWGDPRNPKALVCVHGLTRTGRDFDFLAAALEQDYRVFCPDVVGRGESDWLPDKADYTYPLYVNDLAMLLGTIGLDRAFMLLTRIEGLDLSRASGLDQSQIDIACGDAKTQLPKGLTTPTAWPCPKD